MSSHITTPITSGTDQQGEAQAGESEPAVPGDEEPQA